MRSHAGLGIHALLEVIQVPSVGRSVKDPDDNQEHHDRRGCESDETPTEADPSGEYRVEQHPDRKADEPPCSSRAIQGQSYHLVSNERACIPTHRIVPATRRTAVPETLDELTLHGHLTARSICSTAFATRSTARLRVASSRRKWRLVVLARRCPRRRPATYSRSRAPAPRFPIRSRRQCFIRAPFCRCLRLRARARRSPSPCCLVSIRGRAARGSPELPRC